MFNELYLREVRLKDGASCSDLESQILPFTFTKNITVFIGENGAGKSTLLEAIAINLGCNPEGGGRNFNFNTEDTHSDLHSNIILSKGYKNPKDIYFYRSESFYNVLTEIRNLDSDVYGGPKIASYYGRQDLHSQSHGESMQSLFSYRFKPNSLYILDEPEASLSPTRQLSFIKRLMDLSASGSQFIIATHSPLLMSIPSICLIQVDDGMKEVDFRDTDAYAIYKAVILNGNQYLSTLL